MTMQIIFFTGSAPSDRRRFIIAHDGEAVSFISYCFFHLKPHKAEFDIWMNLKKQIVGNNFVQMQLFHFSPISVKQ